MCEFSSTEPEDKYHFFVTHWMNESVTNYIWTYPGNESNSNIMYSL